ncbi:MAG: FAD-dependent oxidoreductase [Armatimonadetes bacterium]|nr:FAD-dependent oxidoreductase [Armatimonadota bacterium]
MSAQDPIVVIGAGAVGSATAYELARRGRPTVVLESLSDGGATSAASAGLINPLSMFEPELAELGLIGMRLYDEWSARLLKDVQIDIEWLKTGSIRIALTDSEAKTFREEAKRLKTLEPGVEPLSPDEARKIEPLIGPNCRGAILVPGEGNVSGLHLVRALRAAAILHGAELYRGRPVVGFETKGSTVTKVTSAGGSVQASAVVLAAGAWAEPLLKNLGVQIGIKPVRGQLLILADAPKPLRHILGSVLNYVAPKRNGTITLGATVEDAGFDLRATADGFAQLLGSLAATYPALGNATVTGFTVGLRPGSPDGLPLIGRLPGYDNVYLAAGHYRHGIMLAPVTGIAIADLITEGRTTLPIEHLHPSRLVKDA